MLDGGKPDDKTLKSVKKHSEFFTDLAMQEFEFQQQFRPSTIALSCILCARKVSKISPVWNQGLEDLTDYLYDQEIKSCSEKLMKFYDK